MEPADSDFKRRLEFFKNLEKGSKGSASKPVDSNTTGNQSDSKMNTSSRVQRNTLPARSSQVKREELKILVIGPSGAGKSSFINLLYAWSKIDLKLEQLPNLEKLLIPTQHFDGESKSEQNVHNITESQTTTPNLYSFDCDRLQTDRRYHIEILDTPGLRDTRGIQQDDRNVDAIIDEVISKTPDLNAILVMLNGTQARIDSSVNYVLTKLNNMIPNAWRNSVFYLLSNVGLVANMQLDFEHNKENVFQYDNPIFRLSKDVLRKPTQDVRKIYENSTKKVKEMLIKMSACSVKPTTDFAKIKEGRDLLKQKLAEYSDLATNFHHLKANLYEILNNLSTLETSIVQQKLNTILRQKYAGGVPSDEFNTLCLVCKISCHESCKCLTAKNCLSFVEEGNCLKCSHGYNLHVRIKRKYQVYTRNYHNHSDLKDFGNEEQVRKFIQDCIQKFDNDLRFCYLDVLQSSLSLKELCSHFDYFKELSTSLQLLDEQIYLAQRVRGSKYESLVETREKLQRLHDTLLETHHNDYLREVARTQADIESYLSKQADSTNELHSQETIKKNDEEGEEIQSKSLNTQISTRSEEEQKLHISEKIMANEVLDSEEIKTKMEEVIVQIEQVTNNQEKFDLADQHEIHKQKQNFENKVEENNNFGEHEVFKPDQNLESKEEKVHDNVENIEQNPSQSEEIPSISENKTEKAIESNINPEEAKEDAILQNDGINEDNRSPKKESENIEIQKIESNDAEIQNEQQQQSNVEKSDGRVIPEEKKEEHNQEIQNDNAEAYQQTEESAQASWQQYVEHLLNNDKKITNCAFINRENGKILSSKDVKLNYYEKQGKEIDEKKIVLEIFDRRDEVYNEYFGHVYINETDYLVVKDNEDNSFSLRSTHEGGAKLVRTEKLIIFAHFSSGFLDTPNVVDNLAMYLRQFNW